MTLDETSNGRELTVVSGETLDVCLGEIRSEGYHWALVDCGTLELESERFHAPPHERAGKHVWRFRALEPGRTRVRIRYRHGWTADEPLQTFELGLSVVHARAARPP